MVTAIAESTVSESLFAQERFKEWFGLLGVSLTQINPEKKNINFGSLYKGRTKDEQEVTATSFYVPEWTTSRQKWYCDLLVTLLLSTQYEIWGATFLKLIFNRENGSNAIGWIATNKPSVGIGKLLYFIQNRNLAEITTMLAGHFKDYTHTAYQLEDRNEQELQRLILAAQQNPENSWLQQKTNFFKRNRRNWEGVFDKEQEIIFSPDVNLRSGFAGESMKITVHYGDNRLFFIEEMLTPEDISVFHNYPNILKFVRNFQ